MDERMDGAGENEWPWSNRGLAAWAIHPPSIQITVNVNPANQSTVNLKTSQSQPPSGTLYWQSTLLQYMYCMKYECSRWIREAEI